MRLSQRLAAACASSVRYWRQLPVAVFIACFLYLFVKSFVLYCSNIELRGDSQSNTFLSTMRSHVLGEIHDTALFQRFAHFYYLPVI